MSDPKGESRANQSLDDDLDMAIMEGRWDLFEGLVRQGAPLGERIKGPPPLNLLVMVTCKRLDVESLRELLRLGAPVNGRSKDGSTALIGACARGKLACVRALLAAGADPNAKNDDGDSPLITVMKETPKETVRIISELLRGGADPYQQDGLGFTPIGVAEIKSVSESDQGALAVFTAWQERQALEELSSPMAKGKSAGL